jgi:hypothetical protein
MSTNTALKVSREYGDTMPLATLATADVTGIETFTREITQDERATLSSGVTETSIHEEDVMDEKKEQTAVYNAELKKLKGEKKRMLHSLRSGRTEVAETVHTFYDFDNGMTHKYDERGHRIGTPRRMTPTEAQLDIK